MITGDSASGGAVATTSPSLEELQERFVLHWGEMASAWGINRTMGQIHALLYICGEALSMDDIMARLKISRGNASMNLRALEDWGIIQRVHFTGDRREYFRSLSDVWDLFHTVVRERKRREFDPMLRSLRQFLADAALSEQNEPGVAQYRERLRNLVDLLDLLERASDRFLPHAPRELPHLLEVEVQGLE
jgi:DNA-binding transcriptional regulator GbsR (MarR family)